MQISSLTKNLVNKYELSHQKQREHSLPTFRNFVQPNTHNMGYIFCFEQNLIEVKSQ